MRFSILLDLFVNIMGNFVPIYFSSFLSLRRSK